MQGVHFETDVIMVELSNCDVVLGVQWLSTMERI